MASKPPSPSIPPSMRAPAGVPPSGNGKYIILTVVLLGGVGAAIYFKRCQTPPPAPVVETHNETPPPVIKRNVDEEIPLPKAVEEAGVDAGEKKTVVTTVANQCDAKTCTGSTTSEIETALAFRAKQAHRCYDSALAQDPTLRGKVSIAVRIGSGGTTCSAGVASNELTSAPSVAQCVANTFRGQSFSPPRGGCVDVNIPINFVPRQ